MIAHKMHKSIRNTQIPTTIAAIPALDSSDASPPVLASAVGCGVSCSEGVDEGRVEGCDDGSAEGCAEG